MKNKLSALTKAKDNKTQSATKKAGRPKQAIKRIKKIAVLFTESEHEKVLDDATHAGLGVSEYVRSKILS